MLCGAAALASCNLDTIPTDKYTVETFWETEEGTEAAMTGCYNILTNSALFGDSAPLLEETCTPNAYNYNNAGGYNVIAQGTHTANSSGIIANRWKKCYEGIGRCNTHLNRLPAAAVADDRRVQMEGEAKFLRALYYYMLVTYYNGVPLILEEPVYAHGSLPRASREEVVRAILDDLNDIIDRELLDWQWTKAADQGRATRGAAMALKARLLLFEASKLVNPSNDAAKWQAAADAAKAVIEKEAQAGYDLFGDYRKLFLPANEHQLRVRLQHRIFEDQEHGRQFVQRLQRPVPQQRTAARSGDGLPDDDRRCGHDGQVRQPRPAFRGDEFLSREHVPRQGQLPAGEVCSSRASHTGNSRSTTRRSAIRTTATARPTTCSSATPTCC